MTDMSHNPVIASLMNHRSVRRFRQKPIEAEVQRVILAAGTRAATGGNLQLYSFVVVEDTAKREALGVPHAPLAIVSLVDLYRLRRWFALSDTASVCTSRPISFLLGFWDAIIALHNVVIAAESLGLGGYYIGGILATDIRELFDTPEYVFPAGLVALGYPDEAPELSMRLPLRAVVHRNSYRKPSDEEIRSYYAERERVWDTVSDALKERLSTEHIFSIPQAIAVQKFSDKVTAQRSEGIVDNLRKAGFGFSEET